jgi:hypothetical protein
VNSPESCTYEQAALNHVLDSRRATAQQRWDWLCEAIEVGIAHVRERARRGLVTLDGNGNVYWSPELEEEWYGSTDGGAAATGVET